MVFWNAKKLLCWGFSIILRLILNEKVSTGTKNRSYAVCDTMRNGDSRPPLYESALRA